MSKNLSTTVAGASQTVNFPFDKVNISGTIYEDANKNDVQDSGEAGLANITVALFPDLNNDGIINDDANGDGAVNGNDALAIINSDIDGNYAFNAPDGNYVVFVDTNDSDLVGRTYGGTTNSPNDPLNDRRNADISGANIVSGLDYPFDQGPPPDICEAGEPTNRLSFLNNPTLVSGSPLQIGAVYRFPNIFPDVDALIRIDKFNGGATLGAIDNDSTGEISAFQPTLNATAGNATSSVEFEVTLVDANTGTPVAMTFKAAGIDIDGNGDQLREFAELTNITSYTLDPSTTITVTSNPPVTRFESNTTDAQPGVSSNALNTLAVSQYNGISQFRYTIGAINGGSTGALGRLNSLYMGCASRAVSSNPNLTLVKRITAVNTTSVTTTVDDTTDNPATTGVDESTFDNNVNWPTPLDTNSNISEFLKGDISRNNIKPGDELEYTVYFLSSGDKPITNAKICDMIPANTTYVPGSMQLFLNGTTTNLTDAAGDAGEFFAPGNTPTVACPTDNGKGAVVIDVVTSPTQLPNATAPGTPSDSYGYIRFRAKVD